MNFGHHPNPAIDFCVEVDRIEGLRHECQVGMVDDTTLLDAVEKAMRFRVGGDVHAVTAKRRLREIEKWARRGAWS